VSGLSSSSTKAEIRLSASALSALLGKTSRTSFVINASYLGTLNFNRGALSSISGSNSGTISFVTEKLTNMNSAVSGAVAGNPAYNFSVSAGTGNITSFGAGEAVVSIPYSLQTGYNPNQVVGYKVSDTGVLTSVFGRYQSSSAAFEFKLKGFSTYTIKYNPKSYSDVYSSDWYAIPVEYTAARGLMDTFTTSSTLEPGRRITRAEFVVIFMKAYGIEPGTSYSGVAQFQDVSVYSPHAQYIQTAKGMGLVRGTNAAGTTFNPDGQVTRDQFFALTYNALTAMNRMPTSDSGKRLASFIDAGSVGSYATTATDMLIKAGVIGGSATGYLNPTEIFSRREMAQAIYNLITL
jgi:hypothetical protein